MSDAAASPPGRAGRPPEHTDELFGLRFAAWTRSRVAAWCLDVCSAPCPPRARFVVPVNAGICAMLDRRPALRDACRSADLVVADGMSVVWTLRALGSEVPERVTGIDLLADLLAEGAPLGLRVYFLGAREVIVRRMVELCAERYPGLVVAGWRHGYFGSTESDAIVQEVRRARAQLLLLALPSPFKEEWGHEQLARFGVNLVLPVGGSLDVLTRAVPRAPRWMQRCGLEWAWRAVLDPRAYGLRYVKGNTAFVGLALAEWWHRRHGISGAEGIAASGRRGRGDSPREADP